MNDSDADFDFDRVKDGPEDNLVDEDFGTDEDDEEMFDDSDHYPP
jgi:hypothetical protein